MDRSRGRWTALGDLAEVRFGIKSGADDFFYPREVSAESLAHVADAGEFREHFGVPRHQVGSGRVKLVRAGTGEVWPIEARYLEPEVHSLMEIKGFTVRPADCSRLILMVSKPKRALRGTYVLKYILWGEEQGLHRRPTCASRVTQGSARKEGHPREWYDLTGSPRGQLFWAKAHQYRHAVPANNSRSACNCNLYDVLIHEGVSSEILGGILNSSVVVLAKQLYGRPVGVEGNLKTEVIDVKMMLVPDPRQGTPKVLRRLGAAFRALQSRDVLAFLSKRRLREMSYRQRGREGELDALSEATELDQPDRHELDDAVLELLGFRDPSERVALRTELYDHLRRHYEEVRRKEEEAIQNKKRAKRGGRLTADELAAAIYPEIAERYPSVLKPYSDLLTPAFMDSADSFAIPPHGIPEIVDDMVTTGVLFRTGKRKGGVIETRNIEQARLLKLVAETEGLDRREFVPSDPAAAAKLYAAFENLIAERTARVRQAVSNRTADPDLQAEVFEKVMRRITSRRAAP